MVTIALASLTKGLVGSSLVARVGSSLRMRWCRVVSWVGARGSKVTILIAIVTLHLHMVFHFDFRRRIWTRTMLGLLQMVSSMLDLENSNFKL